MKTLELNHLVRFNPATSTYRLGVRMIALGARAEQQVDYMATVRQVLQSTAESVGATAVFAQRVAFDRMMIVLKHESGAGANVSASVGRSFPLTAVSYGKWAVAFADKAEREQILANGLAKVTEFNETDVKKYLNESEIIKKSRILVSRDEYILGVTAVSCPYVNVHAELVGVVSVLGISSAMVDERLATAVERLKAVSLVLGEDLVGSALEH